MEGASARKEARMGAKTTESHCRRTCNPISSIAISASVANCAMHFGSITTPSKSEMLNIRTQRRPRFGCWPKVSRKGLPTLKSSSCAERASNGRPQVARSPEEQNDHCGRLQHRYIETEVVSIFHSGDAGLNCCSNPKVPTTRQRPCIDLTFANNLASVTSETLGVYHSDHNAILTTVNL